MVVQSLSTVTFAMTVHGRLHVDQSLFTVTFAVTDPDTSR